LVSKGRSPLSAKVDPRALNDHFSTNVVRAREAL
jgi:hypothetical protein